MFLIVSSYQEALRSLDRDFLLFAVSHSLERTEKGDLELLVI